MKKSFIFAVLLIFLLLFSAGCAPGTEKWEDDRAGFLAGLWHGIIIVITFIVSLFNDTVGIYEVNNTGWAYDLGFLIGLCFSFIAPWKRKCSKD